MENVMSKVVKHSVWVVLILSLVLYFAFQIMSFSGDITQIYLDWTAWLNVGIVVVLNVQMVSAATDAALNHGINTEEFKLADDINNKLIIKYNNNKEAFREYVRDINKHDLESRREDYLFSIGDKTVDELSPKELKKYNKIKGVVHNIHGFNTALLTEPSGNGKEIKYGIEVNIKKNMLRKKLSKVLNGVLLAGLTINMAVNFGNFGNAFTSLLVITGGLAITFIMIYVPLYTKLKHTVPSAVMRKHTLFSGFEGV